LGLFALRELVLEKGGQVPGLMGWRRSLGDAQPTPSLNSWMSNSTASKSADALIGPLSMGNHRCESDLEWAQLRATAGDSKNSKSSRNSKSKKGSAAAVVLRAKAGKTVRVVAGDEIRWNYGQIDFECKCPDEQGHASRKASGPIPASKRPRRAREPMQLRRCRHPLRALRPDCFVLRPDQSIRFLIDGCVSNFMLVLKELCGTGIGAAGIAAIRSSLRQATSSTRPRTAVKCSTREKHSPERGSWIKF
jgi:hypothetical protein